jgi:hypothetical protein
MSVVKVHKCCPLCKSDYEEVDETQLSDKEKYLMYWNYEIGSPEGEAAWKEKEAMTPKQAPMVIPDISGHISMADGSWVSSRSKHRENLKRNNCVEIGNDVPTTQKKHEFSTKDNETRKRQIAEIAYSKLNYR